MRASDLAIVFIVLYFSVRQPTDRATFAPSFPIHIISVTVRFFEPRAKVVDADSHLPAIAFQRLGVMHSFLLTAWLFLPDCWQAFCAPAYPVTVSLVMKSITQNGRLCQKAADQQHESALQKGLPS